MITTTKKKRKKEKEDQRERNTRVTSITMVKSCVESLLFSFHQEDLECLQKRILG